MRTRVGAQMERTEVVLDDVLTAGDGVVLGRGCFDDGEETTTEPLPLGCGVPFGCEGDSAFFTLR